MTTSQTKHCQNCKKEFVIEPDDFSFYEKIKVPPPTWCLECRLIRRFAWRNERSLYKRVCGLCKRSIVAMYHEEEPFPVYCHDCWYSDKWDSLSYGTQYDFSKPFFIQWKELFDRVPRLNLWQLDMVDSPYSNIVRGARNAYLSYSLVGEGGENIFYSKTVDASSNIFDCLGINNCENCYENVHGAGNANSQYCVESRNNIDCHFLFDCRNCQNCVLSANLRNKRYMIRNKQYGKDEYFKELGKLNFGSYGKREEIKKKFNGLILKALHKYADIVKSVRTSGNYNANARNAVNCFNAGNVENIKHCQRVVDLKDSYDVSYHINSELVYEYVSGGKNLQNTRFAMAAFDALTDIDYTDHCASCSNLFGCVGVRNKRYCVLNKEYGKGEYGALRIKIIEHMSKMPYVDSIGRLYSYGEFFPIDLSPFGYNETIAQEHFPIDKKEAGDKGYRWREKEKSQYNATVGSGDLSDHIDDIQDSILKEIIICEHHEKNEHTAFCEANCTTAFKIMPLELQFYRHKQIPVPRICPNCRHFERLRNITPFKLWHRRCMKPGCMNEFETPYAPERPEIIYCESCYNAEVV